MKQSDFPFLSLSFFVFPFLCVSFFVSDLMFLLLVGTLFPGLCFNNGAFSFR